MKLIKAVCALAVTAQKLQGEQGKGGVPQMWPHQQKRKKTVEGWKTGSVAHFECFISASHRPQRCKLSENTLCFFAEMRARWKEMIISCVIF